MTIPNAELIIDKLCEELDLANLEKDFEKAKSISLEISKLVEEIKGDVIQVRTLH